MKRLSLVLVALMLLLVGCGNTQNASNSGDDKGYVFETNGVTIAMNAEAAPILKSLGKEKDYFEAKSCAFQGLEKTYTYNGFELHTYEVNGVDCVSAITFLDDSVSTKEGISLCSNLDDMIKAYGDKGKKNLGLYTYESGKTKLSILIENDKVTSIEYNVIAK